MSVHMNLDISGVSVESTEEKKKKRPMMLKKGKIKQDREVNESASRTRMLVILSTCSVGAS